MGYNVITHWSDHHLILPSASFKHQEYLEVATSAAVIGVEVEMLQNKQQQIGERGGYGKG